MQSKTLLSRTGCSEPIFKGWLRTGVIVPARPGQGPGTHADYDEANAVALLIAVKMKHVGVIVANYAQAFAALQEWLRSTSSLEWPQHMVAMTPEAAMVHPAKKSFAVDDLAFVIPLAAICDMLSESVEDPGFYQYSLLGLQPVRKTR
ncbi:hypothetical protein [Massilia oculi]|uniref:hypothetical protein n=1 Tax=Massilia oculi TaxID=945844 RepID=UPI0028ACF294|nr:hypothetical protein [Massilia oculi]